MSHLFTVIGRRVSCYALIIPSPRQVESRVKQLSVQLSTLMRQMLTSITRISLVQCIRDRIAIHRWGKDYDEMIAWLAEVREALGDASQYFPQS